MRHTCYLLLLATLAGCTTPPPAVKTDASAVKTDVPKKKALRRVIEQPASIEAFEETALVAHISGYVEKVNVDIGAEVETPKVDDKGKQLKPGTLLAELFVPELLKELEQKQALVTQALAEVDQAKAAHDAAEAHVLTAQAQTREASAAVGRADANQERWRSESVRLAELVRNKVIDRQILDETLNQYESAKAMSKEIEAKVQSAQASAKKAEAKRAKAKSEVDTAKARVSVARAAEGRLQALVDYRHVYPPFDGVVTRRFIHPGHYLQPNASGGPTVLFIVARTSKLRIVVDVPEAEAQYITDGLDAAIHVPALSAPSFTDKVARTSRALDAKSRTLRVEIDYVNEKKKLRPGMFANVTFTVDLGERFTLPATALFTHADQPCCWRVDDARNAVRTPLKLGVRDGQSIEILALQTPGLTWETVTGKEQIVVTNLGAISEGKEVRIEGK